MKKIKLQMQVSIDGFVQILEKPGKNMQSARLIRFTNIQEIVTMKTIILTSGRQRGLSATFFPT